MLFTTTLLDAELSEMPASLLWSVVLLLTVELVAPLSRMPFAVSPSTGCPL